MAFKKLFILTLFMPVLLFLYSCGVGTAKKEAAEERTEFALDTVITVRVFDKQPEEKTWNDIFSVVRNAEKIFDRFDETSEIFKISESAGIAAVGISAETLFLLDNAKKIAIETDGCFDPTIGALTDLWGIGGKDFAPPSSEEIEKAKSKVDFTRLDIWQEEAENPIGMYASLKEKGMILDLGGIAKGYACDLTVKKLAELGIERAILDFGGNIYAVGKSPNGSAWNIGIKNPNKTDEIILKVAAADEAVVSSGGYERFSTYEGKRYHHIIDPFSGEPTNTDVIAATVVHPISLYADAYSTSLIVMGKEKAIDFIKEHKIIAVLFYADGNYDIFCDDKSKIVEYKN